MDNLIKFVLEIQKFKMKELWNNENDDFSDLLKHSENVAEKLWDNEVDNLIWNEYLK